MGKGSGSAIGVDIGPRMAKAVHLRHSAGRVELAGYAFEESTEFFSGTTTERGGALKRLVKNVGGGRREVGVAVSAGTMFLRLLEQPEMPVATLREALRLNGPVLVNQDCRGYVLDCGLVDCPKSGAGGAVGGGHADGGKRRYLAGGILRTEVESLAEACQKAGFGVGCIQMSAVSTLNAFEYGWPEAFGGKGFLLLDLGHTVFTMMAGSGRELLLLRSLEGGNRGLMEELTGGGAISEAQVLAELENGEAGIRERVRGGLMVLVRQVLASVGFLESRVGGDVTQVYVSGGGAGWSRVVGVLSEELQMECVPWSPLGAGVPLPAGAPVGLHGACGAALQVMGMPGMQ